MARYLSEAVAISFDTTNYDAVDVLSGIECTKILAKIKAVSVNSK